MAKTESLFTEVAIPKSSAGRKGEAIDQALADALVSAFRDFTALDVDGELRPRALGAPKDYDTRGKAASIGNKYKQYVAGKLGKKVRLSVIGKGEPNQKGEQTAPFNWRIYIPLSESDGESATES